MKRFAAIKTVVQYEVSHAWLRRRCGRSHEMSSPVRGALAKLDAFGLYRIEGYWSESKIDATLSHLVVLEHAISDADRQRYVKSRYGATRIYNVERFSDTVRSDYFNDELILKVAEGFYGRRLCPTLSMYARTTYSDRALSVADDVKTIGFGRGGFHMDGHENCLKTFLLLSDVDMDNGPFMYCVGSHRMSLDRLVKTYRSMVAGAFSDNTLYYYSPAEAAREKLETRAAPLTGRRGTLVLVNTRGWHKAAVLRRGERHLLWNYF
jgi:hypothetical protein